MSHLCDFMKLVAILIHVNKAAISAQEVQAGRHFVTDINGKDMIVVHSKTQRFMSVLEFQLFVTKHNST